METVLEVPIIHHHHQRITSHSKLSEIVQVFKAPPVKVVAPKNKGVSLGKRDKNEFLDKTRRNYYVHRIKTFSKKAQDPDMNMTLNEIRTGVKTSERMTLSLLVYLLGVLVIFWNLF